MWWWFIILWTLQLLQVQLKKVNQVQVRWNWWFNRCIIATSTAGQGNGSAEVLIGVSGEITYVNQHSQQQHQLQLYQLFPDLSVAPYNIKDCSISGKRSNIPLNTDIIGIV